jgi:hypothetical protein
MTVVIDDVFTVAFNTDLVDHTPTGVGTGYTEIENTGTTTVVAFCDAANDRLQLTADDDDDRKLYTAQGTYTSNEYDVEIEIRVRAATFNDPFWLLGRTTDSNNYYATGIERTAGVDAYLLKKVSGVVTVLDSADTDNNWTATSLKLEIRDAAKKLFWDSSGGKDSYSEILSTADDVITAIGEAGIAWGNIRDAGDDADASWKVDGFLVTEVAGGPPPETEFGLHAVEAGVAGAQQGLCGIEDTRVP